MHNRGWKDIRITGVDGLTGFPDAIHTVYPAARLQWCMVHMVRNSRKYVSGKDYKAVTAGLTRLYPSLTEEEAQREWHAFAPKWGGKYPHISQSGRTHRPHLIPLLDYPDEIRTVIYTTNAIASRNSVFRKVIKKRKRFPHDDAALKIVYPAISEASKQ